MATSRKDPHARQIHIVLHQPVIPQNTGSIARLCACIGASLHLIHPLGFRIDEASVKRAGLDYWPHVDIHEHDSWQAFLEREQPRDYYLFTKFGSRSYTDVKYTTPTYLVFGSETKGIPKEIRDAHEEHLVWIPMRTDLVRSLNLSQAAAVGAYEAIRQTGVRIENPLNFQELNEDISPCL
jgi:tRNA (cytidine/uridine-2'-O-)-methyltransferase